MTGLKREPTRAGAFSVTFAEGTNLERERTSEYFVYLWSCYLLNTNSFVHCEMCYQSKDSACESCHITLTGLCGVEWNATSLLKDLWWSLPVLCRHLQF